MPWSTPAMSSPQPPERFGGDALLPVEEQRILRQIELGLHHDDPWFGWHLTMIRIHSLPYRRSARVCLVIELAFVALTVVGAMLQLSTLLMLSAAFGLLFPMAGPSPVASGQIR
jgi:Protein of unknown function (DUF3040)